MEDENEDTNNVARRSSDRNKPIRYVGIDHMAALSFHGDKKHRSFSRAFLHQLFHLRPYRSLVLSLKLPCISFPKVAGEYAKRYEALRAIQRMFCHFQLLENLPTPEECAGLEDDSARIVVPAIRSFVSSNHAYTPSDKIYSTNADKKGLVY